MSLLPFLVIGSTIYLSKNSLIGRGGVRREKLRGSIGIYSIATWTVTTLLIMMMIEDWDLGQDG